MAATLDSVALTVSGVEVDVSGVANLTVSGELGLARVTPDGQPVRYTALTMGNVTITGSVTLAIDLTAELTVNKLQYNHAEGAYDPLDWTTAFDLDGDGTPDLLDPGALLPTPVDLTIDFGSSLEVKVSGTLSGNGGSGDRILEIAGVSLSGSVSFTLSLQTVDIQDPLGDPKVGVQLTTLAFGINSPLTLAVDSISASITAGGLAIATIKLADNTEYFGLRGENLAATITGVPGLEGALTDVTIKINKATDGTGMPTTALNWQTSVDLDSDGAFDAGSVGIVDPGLDLVPPRSLPIDFTTELVSFAAIVDIDLFGIIHISASFAVNATITDVDTDGDSGLDIDDADLTTYAVSVDPFADRVQSVTIQVEGIGVRITAGDVVIAVVEAADGRAFFAVRADNIEAELIGLPDAIALYITGISVEFNSAQASSGELDALDWTTALDFDGVPGFGDVVDPGQSLPVPKLLPITSTTERLRIVAGGALDIGPGNVVAVIPAGGLILDLATADVTTGNGTLGTLTDAKVTVFSVTGAALFVGDGAELNETLDGIYDEAGEGALTSDAVGFSVTGASFTLALVESATDSFTGIEATVSDASLVGIDEIDLAVAG
jgi:hypothetical protein